MLLNRLVGSNLTVKYVDIMKASPVHARCRKHTVIGLWLICMIHMLSFCLGFLKHRCNQDGK